jgi:hypothetical protein
MDETTPALKSAPLPILLAAITCEDHSRSERDGSLSLLRLRYVLPITALPVERSLVVVSLWWLRGVGQCAIATRLRDPQGGVLAEVSDTLSYAQDAIHEHAAQLAGVPLTQAGLYRIEVLLAGEVASAAPLFVELTSAPTNNAAVEPTEVTDDRPIH